MKKFFLITLCTLFMSAISFAQTGNNSVGIRAEVGVPIGDFGDAYSTGFGGSVIGLFGIGTASQISVRSGYMKFKYDVNNIDASSNLIPIMAGYRHNFSGFYLQPEVGVGMLGFKLSGGESDHESKFAWAIGAGIARGGFDGGVRYERISTDLNDIQFSFIGIHVGYNFTLGGGGTMSK